MCIRDRKRIAKIPPDRTEYEAGFGLPPFEDRGSGSHFAILSRHPPAALKVATHPSASIITTAGSHACRVSNNLASQAGAIWAQELCALAFFALKSAIISRLKAGRSEGCRLLIQLRSRTTSRSTHWPPELRMSSWMV